jgi:hypothetical protein
MISKLGGPPIKGMPLNTLNPRPHRTGWKVLTWYRNNLSLRINLTTQVGVVVWPPGHCLPKSTKPILCSSNKWVNRRRASLSKEALAGTEVLGLVQLAHSRGCLTPSHKLLLSKIMNSKSHPKLTSEWFSELGRCSTLRADPSVASITALSAHLTDAIWLLTGQNERE